MTVNDRQSANQQGTPTADPAHPQVEKTAFFGWAIVAATFVIQTVGMGTAFYAFGALAVPLAETLGVGRGEVFLTPSLMLITTSLASPLIGSLASTGSIRSLMLVGAALLSLGFLLVSTANSIGSLYFGWSVVLGLASVATGTIPSSTLVSNWFARMRGRALGISLLGLSAAGVVVIPIVSGLVESFGWRTAVAALAVAPALILIPLIWFVIVNRPEDRGQLPDGDPVAETASVAVLRTEPAEPWTLARSLANPTVWKVVFVMGFASVPSIALVQLLISHAGDIGLTPAQAAGSFAAMTISAAAAKPLVGALTDYFSTRAVFAATLALQVVGLILVTQLTNPLGFTLAAALFGLGFGGIMPIYVVTLGALFGTASLGRVMGIVDPLQMPFIIVGPPLAGYVFDATGSYQPAFIGFSACIAVSFILLQWLPIPDSRD